MALRQKLRAFFFFFFFFFFCIRSSSRRRIPPPNPNGAVDDGPAFPPRSLQSERVPRRQLEKLFSFDDGAEVARSNRGPPIVVSRLPTPPSSALLAPNARYLPTAAGSSPLDGWTNIAMPSSVAPPPSPPPPPPTSTPLVGAILTSFWSAPLPLSTRTRGSRHLPTPSARHVCQNRYMQPAGTRTEEILFPENTKPSATSTVMWNSCCPADRFATQYVAVNCSPWNACGGTSAQKMTSRIWRGAAVNVKKAGLRRPSGQPGRSPLFRDRYEPATATVSR
ncbi:MAG: hypothetical protein BJ554DRAFT_495 [Olpidium bornovanus]|uniref:Uncharacterized protein n=1 Tax=Olpidium bornovanus TaxID=278681 RepID=A0A8H8DI35_9FUNG|nr:MAG: hypothetical protein BJ554DRAFT_495 [Olpidium bornovanus]